MARLVRKSSSRTRRPKSRRSTHALPRFLQRPISLNDIRFSVDNTYISNPQDRPNKGLSKPRDYWSFYEGMFFSKRKRAINLLEIGVAEGTSLKIWKEYFKNYNKIIGIDIDSKEKIDGVDIIHGDATTQDIFNEHNFKELKYDFIIDDGSHKGEQIVKSFDLFYPLLKSGGIYIVEDVKPAAEEEIFKQDHIKKLDPLLISWRGTDWIRRHHRGAHQALMVFVHE